MVVGESDSSNWKFQSPFLILVQSARLKSCLAVAVFLKITSSTTTSHRSDFPIGGSSMTSFTVFSLLEKTRSRQESWSFRKRVDVVTCWYKFISSTSSTNLDVNDVSATRLRRKFQSICGRLKSPQMRTWLKFAVDAILRIDSKRSLLESGEFGLLYTTPTSSDLLSKMSSQTLRHQKVGRPSDVRNLICTTPPLGLVGPSRRNGCLNTVSSLPPQAHCPSLSQMPQIPSGQVRGVPLNQPNC